MRALNDVIYTCKMAQKRHPASADIQHESTEAHRNIKILRGHMQEQGLSTEIQTDQLCCGAILMRLYPWTPTPFQTRSKSLLDSTRAELKLYSTKLQVQPSALGSSTSDKITSFGMFARRNIQKGDVILSAPHLISASTKALHTRCYNCHTDLLSGSMMASLSCCPTIRFCGEGCRGIAEQYYHKAFCGKVFDEVRTVHMDSPIVANDLRMKELVFLRVLAICVQGHCHPLQNPIISRLMPQYMTEMPITWSFQSDIITPIEILQSLGVDVFTAPEYDTWVIQTIW